MSQNLQRIIYFDNAATTPPLPCVIEKLHELTSNIYGNPSSTHRIGRQAQEVYNDTQEYLAALFQVPPSHIIFTSGGTESNNLAIWGALGGLTHAIQWIKSDGQGRLMTSTVEHDATKKPFEALQQLGANVKWLPVAHDGKICLNQLESSLDARVKFVSLHHIQNEVGVKQDIKEIVKIIRRQHPDALVHIDAIQSFLKTPLSFDELDVDLISVSSHKIGGPKGVGALILGKRFEKRNPKLCPFIQGSPQQHGMRPGTIPVPLIGAFRTAIQWGHDHFEENIAKLNQLRTYLIQHLPKQALLNGSTDSLAQAPQTINFSIPGLPSAVAVESLSSKGICISAGSACHSTSPKPNETLTKMGHAPERALSAIRISFSPKNTIEEVNNFVNSLTDVIDLFG